MPAVPLRLALALSLVALSLLLPADGAAADAPAPFPAPAGAPDGSPWHVTLRISESSFADWTRPNEGGGTRRDRDEHQETLTWTSTAVQPHEAPFPWRLDGRGRFTASIDRLIANDFTGMTFWIPGSLEGTPGGYCWDTESGSWAGGIQQPSTASFDFSPIDAGHPEQGMQSWSIDLWGFAQTPLLTTQREAGGECVVGQGGPSGPQAPGSYVAALSTFAKFAGDRDGRTAQGPPIPTPAVERLEDGSIRISGTVVDWWYPTQHDGTVNVHQRLEYDFTCTRPAECWPLHPPPSAEEQQQNLPKDRLTVVVPRPQFGSVVAPGINCGRGQVQCAVEVTRGQEVLLRTTQSEAGTFLAWVGCDEAVGTTCRVRMTTPREVRALFVYDFVGQAQPPLDGLFSLDRKAEIAGNGADAAANGAMGCAKTAGVIAFGLVSPGLAAGGAGVMTRNQAMLEKLIEETLQDCAQGVLGTMYNGLLLKVDPPDPAWRSLAVAEAMPKVRVGRCPVRRRCAAVQTARKRLAEARRAVAERQEALAVASNRFGNAVGAGDRSMQALHAISMRVQSGMLADALDRADARSAALAAALRSAGVRSLKIPRKLVARAMAARAKGRGVPKAVVTRLLRKHLIASRGEVAATVRAEAKRATPKALDVMAALRRRSPTAAMRRDAAALRLEDLVVLARTLAVQEHAIPPAVSEQEAQIEAVLRCDTGSVTALRSLAERSVAALRGDAGAQVAWLARRLATAGVPSGPACAAP